MDKTYINFKDFKTLKEARETIGNKLSVARLRQLCQENMVIYERITPKLYFISMKSLHAYLATDRKSGPKKSTH